MSSITTIVKLEFVIQRLDKTSSVHRLRTGIPHLRDASSSPQHPFRIYIIRIDRTDSTKKFSEGSDRNPCWPWTTSPRSSWTPQHCWRDEKPNVFEDKATRLSAIQLTSRIHDFSTSSSYLPDIIRRMPVRKQLQDKSTRFLSQKRTAKMKETRKLVRLWTKELDLPYGQRWSLIEEVDWLGNTADDVIFSAGR